MDFPRNKKEFIAFMEVIEESLKEQGVPFSHRPIYAVREAAMRLNVNIQIAPNDIPLQEDIYNEINISTHIKEWYDKRYGKRINVITSPGSLAISLKGDPWKIYFPRIFGRITVICDRDLNKIKSHPRIVIGRSEPIYYNALNYIDDITPEFASTLTDSELNLIKEFFILGFDTLYRLEDIISKPFIKFAFADLKSCVINIFSAPPNFGLSKWSSLQFMEKLIKCFLEIKSVDYPKSHNLNRLSELAELNGLPTLDREKISVIQCSAGVRYGDENVTFTDSINAHHCSIKLASIIIQEIKTL